MKSPVEFSKVRYIAAVWPSHGSFHGENEEHEAGTSPSHITNNIGAVLEHCPQLEEYSLVIDARDLDLTWEEAFTTREGRFPMSRAKGHLVEATLEACNEGGVIVRGEAMLAPGALDPLADSFKAEKPDLKVPRFRLELFIGDRPLEKLRKWDLFGGKCSIDGGRDPKTRGSHGSWPFEDDPWNRDSESESGEE
jgi:hypothetical protein